MCPLASHVDKIRSMKLTVMRSLHNFITSKEQPADEVCIMVVVVLVDNRGLVRPKLCDSPRRDKTGDYNTLCAWGVCSKGHNSTSSCVVKNFGFFLGDHTRYCVPSVVIGVRTASDQRSPKPSSPYRLPGRQPSQVMHPPKSQT